MAGPTGPSRPSIRHSLVCRPTISQLGAVFPEFERRAECRGFLGVVNPRGYPAIFDRPILFVGCLSRRRSAEESCFYPFPQMTRNKQGAPSRKGAPTMHLLTQPEVCRELRVSRATL